jgi:hypothetical protein
MLTMLCGAASQGCGARTELVTAEPPPPACAAGTVVASTDVVSIAVDDSRLYWVSANPGSLNQCDKTACTAATTPWADADTYSDIALSSTCPLVTGMGGVYGCTLEVLAPLRGLGAAELAIDATQVFFESLDGIATCPLTGCT